MAELSLLPALRAADPADLVVADGFSCRHQIADLAGREALHSLRVLERGAVTAQDPRIAEILSFWFADGPDVFRRLWFRGTPDFDEEIRRRFGHLLLPAREGTFDSWAETADGTLALLLLDQFPRNLFRGSAESLCRRRQGASHRPPGGVRPALSPAA